MTQIQLSYDISGYLASKKEAAPDANGNGPKTAQYFKDNFDMSPRESLALMGAHTIGGFSTFATHIDYAWVRHLDSSRTKVFNNEYYKELAARPAHVKVSLILEIWTYFELNMIF